MKFFHYTCGHCVRALRKMSNPVLMPSPIIWLPPQEAVWLTDLPRPDAFGLGLTSEFTPCDRTEFRLDVAPVDVLPWSEAAKLWRCPRDIQRAMELDRMPEHWFVSCEFVPVLSIRRTESVPA